MNAQHDEATRQFYILARLETYDDEWTSLHWTYEDAERQLKAVGEAWGVGFTPDGEPADGFLHYGAEEVPVLGPEESGQAPEESSSGVSLPEEDARTWTWLIGRRVPDGVSAEEMAHDLGITSDVAALRLVSLTALELAHEVSPGRYRPGSKVAAHIAAAVNAEPECPVTGKEHVLYTDEDTGREYCGECGFNDPLFDDKDQL